MNKRILSGACALALLAAAPALAQNAVRSAGEKITFQAYREWSAAAYGNAAYHNAAALNEYARNYSYIPYETAQEHAGEVRRNVTAAKKEVSKLAPAAKTNKTLARHVETIQGHYDKALEHTTALEKESAKNDKADTKKLAESASGMTESLKAAEAEHKKLSEHLKSTEK
jgi:hypothetical protein